jgi:hypothetical protein
MAIFDRRIQKTRVGHFGDQTCRTVVGCVGNIVTHQQLLAYHTDTLSAVRQCVLKPTDQFTGAVQGILSVRIVKSKIYFHVINLRFPAAPD